MQVVSAETCFATGGGGGVWRAENLVFTAVVVQAHCSPAVLAPGGSWPPPAPWRHTKCGHPLVSAGESHRRRRLRRQPTANSAENDRNGVIDLSGGGGGGGGGEREVAEKRPGSPGLALIRNLNGRSQGSSCTATASEPRPSKRQHLPDSYDLSGGRSTASDRNDGGPRYTQEDMEATGEGVVGALSFEERLARDNAAVPVVDLLSEDEQGAAPGHSSHPAFGRKVDPKHSPGTGGPDSDSGSDVEGVSGSGGGWAADAGQLFCTFCGIRAGPAERETTPVAPVVTVRLDDGTAAVTAELHPTVAAELLPQLTALAGDRSAAAAGRIEDCLAPLLGCEYRMGLTMLYSDGKLRCRVDCCLPAGAGRSVALSAELAAAQLAAAGLGGPAADPRARFLGRSVALSESEDEDGSSLLECF